MAEKENRQPESSVPEASQATAKVAEPQANDEKVDSKDALTPMVSININSMLEDIKKKEKERSEARSSLSIEKIQSVWDAYKAENESPSVQAALGNCILKLEDVLLTIVVPNITSQNIIKAETALLELIRSETGTPIKYSYVVDVTQFPDVQEDKPVSLMSDREKFALLYSENQEFKSLVDKFNLKLDND